VLIRGCDGCTRPCLRRRTISLGSLDRSASGFFGGLSSFRSRSSQTAQDAALVRAEIEVGPCGVRLPARGAESGPLLARFQVSSTTRDVAASHIPTSDCGRHGKLLDVVSHFFEASASAIGGRIESYFNGPHDLGNTIVLHSTGGTCRTSETPTKPSSSSLVRPEAPIAPRMRCFDQRATLSSGQRGDVRLHECVR